MKTPRSGMKSRLGFAVAVNVDPDILVIDEALSAGDAAFKKRALQRMYDLRDSGTTVLFVSHSMGMVNRFCTDAVLLHRGHMISRGTPEEVAASTATYWRSPRTRRRTRTQSGPATRLHHRPRGRRRHARPPEGQTRAAPSYGEAEILDMRLLDEDRQPAERVPAGSNLTVRVRARYAKAVEDSAFGAVLRDRAESSCSRPRRTWRSPRWAPGRRMRSSP